MLLRNVGTHEHTHTHTVFVGLAYKHHFKKGFLQTPIFEETLLVSLCREIMIRDNPLSTCPCQFKGHL